MSAAGLFSSFPQNLSYRCYNCNCAFYLTPAATTTITAVTSAASAASSSFRCPHCFHRHVLPNYTISNFIPQPSQEPSSYSNGVTDHVVLESYDSDSESESDSDSDSGLTDGYSEDFTFELFNSTPTDPFCSPILKTFVNALPSVKINEESKSCSICMEEFVIGSEASQLPCRHFYHHGCIVPWLHQSNTCPMCRHKLPKQNFEDEKFKEELVLFLNLATGDSEFSFYSEEELLRVLFGPPSSILREGADEGVHEVMQDEDGDTLMIDA